MSNIEDLGNQIRKYINIPRKHRALFEDPLEFPKLCSCLDMIGDTELAFRAHEEMPDPIPPGASYLLAYGFLQALFLQQNAVCHLHEALGLPYEPDPLLLEIRELRNDAVGHPTKRGRGKGRSFSFISRPTISKFGFDLMTVEPSKGPPIFQHVDFQTLLDTQHRQLNAGLEALLRSLKKEEMEHREQFKDEKLSALFPEALSYYIQKIYESTRGERGWEYGALHIKLLMEIVQHLRAALRRRGIAGAYQGLEYQIEELDYPLAQLAEYFDQKGQGRLNEKDVAIFTSFVEAEMFKLREMMIEIDKEYTAQPEP